jgi:hypothetical protein
MTALGHERRFWGDKVTSAPHPKASDQTAVAVNFRFSIKCVGLHAKCDWQQRATTSHPNQSIKTDSAVFIQCRQRRRIEFQRAEPQHQFLLPKSMAA